MFMELWSLYSCAVFCLAAIVNVEDPYRFFTWNGILINGQFPGPEIYFVTNDNLIINVFNNLTEPFLISW
ncbi:putative cupredoxin, multicopper oxidase, type 3 [Helianthus anomalus]